MKNKKIFKIIYKNCLLLTLFIIITGFLLKLINIYTPLLTRIIIDNISKYKDIKLLHKNLVYIIFILVIFLIVSFINSLLNILYNAKIEINIRKFYLNEIMLKSIEFFENFSKGEIIYRVEKDFLSISNFFNQIFISIPLNITMFSSIFFMIKWSIELTFFIIILILLQSTIILLFKKPLSILSKKFKEKAETLNNFYISLLDRIFIVKINNAYIQEKINHYKCLNNLVKVFKIKSTISEISSILIHFIFNLWTFAIIWYGGKEVINDKMTIGQIFGFMLYSNMLASPINYFINFFFSIPTFKVSLKRVNKILNYKNENYSINILKLITNEKKKDKLINEIIKTKIKLKSNNSYNYKNNKYKLIIENLNFAYHNNNKVLKGINLTIPSTGISIICGKSGCGKSTFAKLLTGFYLNYNGNIFFNGKEIRKYKVDELRKKIVYMPQNKFLIDENFYENIFYGNKNNDFLVQFQNEWIKKKFKKNNFSPY